jgi:hypothetical protein
VHELGEAATLVQEMIRVRGGAVALDQDRLRGRGGVGVATITGGRPERRRRR